MASNLAKFLEIISMADSLQKLDQRYVDEVIKQMDSNIKDTSFVLSILAAHSRVAFLEPAHVKKMSNSLLGSILKETQNKEMSVYMKREYTSLIKLLEVVYDLP